jgi:hypothetical protein
MNLGNEEPPDAVLTYMKILRALYPKMYGRR